MSAAAYSWGDWVRVREDASVKDVKEALQDLQGFPPCTQRLLFGDMILADDRSVVDCGLGDGSALDMVVSLRAC